MLTFRDYGQSLYGHTLYYFATFLQVSNYFEIKRYFNLLFKDHGS